LGPNQGGTKVMQPRPAITIRTPITAIGRYARALGRHAVAAISSMKRFGVVTADLPQKFRPVAIRGSADLRHRGGEVGGGAGRCAARLLNAANGSKVVFEPWPIRRKNETLKKIGMACALDGA